MKRLAIITSLLAAANVQAAPPPIPSSREAGICRAMVNVSNAANLYDDSDHYTAEAIITDIGVQFHDNLSVLPNFNECQRWATNRFPSALIGGYHSSRCAKSRPDIEDDPPREFQVEWFEQSELLPEMFLDNGRRIVDYRQPIARCKLIRFQVEWCLRNHVMLLFSDNWSHAGSWQGFIDFRSTLHYMAELRDALHKRDIALICNLATFQSLAMGDAISLGKATDAVCFEDSAPLVPDASAAARLVANYQAITAGGCRVVMIPTYAAMGDGTLDWDATAEEADFTAGQAMLFGDGQWVAWPFNIPRGSWTFLPARLGNPQGECKLSGTIATRQFAHATLSVDFVTRKTTVQLTSRNSLTDFPK